MNNSTDVLIIGAGIVGITIARELKSRRPNLKITVIEKEASLALHSSGRNSGVMHSGIYYQPGTLKAQICALGAKEMIAYCLERNLPMNPLGKLLIPARQADIPQLNNLMNRAKANKVNVHELDEVELKKMEPEVRAFGGKALYVPQTSVIDPKKTLESLFQDCKNRGIEVFFNQKIVNIDSSKRQAKTQNSSFTYGYLVNTAGLMADLVANMLSLGKRYTLLPFRGNYWKLNPNSKIKINHLVYPIPDLNLPFLGIHTTTSADGTIYLGPSSAPAWSRENYQGLQGLKLPDFLRITRLLAQQFYSGNDGFRALAIQEGQRYFKINFLKAAQALIPGLKESDLMPCDKVGIRAQLLDLKTGRLVHDFLLEQDEQSIHILNAISPAFTCSLPFARYICDKISI